LLACLLTYLLAAETARVTIRSLIAVDRLTLTIILNDVCKFGFTSIVVNTRNSVNTNVASANTLNWFKSRVD